jgi:hypothetical protein
MSPRPVFFYLPVADVPPFDRLPDADEMSLHPRRFLSPALNWVWRTFLHLRSDGLPCQLVTSMPDEGLIVTAACNLPLLYRPTARQFIVSCVADSPPRFFTPCQLFQSATQAALQCSASGFPANVHMPHWPQPGLLHRDPARGNEFRHIDYFGAHDQLAPELRLPETGARLRSMNLELRLNLDHYHDYRTTDAVVAVRSFGGPVISHKPASKLINAWLAGVPAMLGIENAFRELRVSPHDYIELHSAEAFIDACARLRDDPAAREAMITNGHERAREFSNAALTLRWRTLLTETLPPIQERWRSLSAVQRQLFFAERSVRRLSTSLARRCGLVNT